MIRYFLKIKKSVTGYTGSLRSGKSRNAFSLQELKLGKDAEITIKDRPYKIGALIRALIEYKEDDLSLAFDERGQLEIGQYLYAQTFGRLMESEQRSLQLQNETDVRIITSDEHICRLPWALIADKGIFLCAAGWSVSLSTKTKVTDYELPPSPEILVIAPQPVGIPKTHAESHLEELEKRLSAVNHLFRWGRNLRLCRTWEEFTETIKTFHPQILYYYGHGEESKDSLYKSKLVFASGQDHQPLPKPISDLANCLRNMEKPPQMAYLNCCLGDAGGFLGAGMQLGDFIPVVITNRTIATIEAAQAQATAFWEDILLKGMSPHRAVATLYGRMTDLGLSTADVRWMTPVMYSHYDNWKSNPPSPPDRLIHDPYWHLKIDRVAQFSIVAEQTRQMLRERKPRSLVFVWYGQEGQGMEMFHQRLNVELGQGLSNTYLMEIRPRWEDEFDNPYISFRNMILEAFSVKSMDEIPAKIRFKSQGTFGRQTLVYVRHQTVKSAKLINPAILKKYLEWWDHIFVPLLKDSPYFALLGISVMVKNPPKFRNIILEEERFEDADLHDTVFRLLDEMEKVARRDLLDFFRSHNIRLPIKHKEQVISRVLEKTGGHYNKTVAELENLVALAWNLSEEEDNSSKKLKEEYDY